MIRVRKMNGEVVPVVEGQFVELVDDNTGAIAMVVFIVPGMILEVVPGSQDAARYEQMFGKYGVKFNKLMIQRRA